MSKRGKRGNVHTGAGEIRLLMTPKARYFGAVHPSARTAQRTGRTPQRVLPGFMETLQPRKREGVQRMYCRKG